jgi:hypothetical protein
MGKIKNNVIMQGFSGMLGQDLIIKQIDGKTYFVSRPTIKTPPSARQTESRSKFTEASLFASTAIENPQEYQHYQLVAQFQKLKSAYVAAMTDFLTLPLVETVFTRAYRGTIGDRITITPKLPYKVTDVQVTIVSADGTELEKGSATINGLKWRYTVTASNAQVQGSRLKLITSDRLGKESVFEQVLV